jgi:hypothetical protein
VRTTPPRNESLDGALVVAAVAMASLTQGCAESRRSLGAECLKSQDCLSGICSQFACAAAPPTLDTEENAEAGVPEAAPLPDAGPDTGPDATASSGGGDGDAVEASGGD